jgi:hypothetical protein
MKTYIPFCFALLFILHMDMNAQGCVATRGMSSCGASNSMGIGISLSPGEWNFVTGFRYFESFRHFRGDHEEPQRVANGTEVWNWSSFLDLTLSYGITDQLYATATLPYMHHNRSSMYEHGGNPPTGLGQRHSTGSSGLSDARFGIGYWLFEPFEHEFNYAIGIGVKLASGQYDCQDMFYNQGSNRDTNMLQFVDQSIQLGDGGTGITIDLQGYHPISSTVAIATNAFYLFNPRETNGIPTLRKDAFGNIIEFSVPDQYGARIGAFYNTTNGFSGYVGGRIEGVPSHDAFGGSRGFRRPGYAVSFEPGISYAFGGMSVFASLPIAMYRNRIQSYDDLEKTRVTGVFTNGDAAFADYTINLGFSWRFGGKDHKM